MGLAGGSLASTWGVESPPNRDAGDHLLGLSWGDLMWVPQPRTQQDVTCVPLPQ